MPHEIGGGPASPLEPIMISRNFFERTLHCDHNCAACDYCSDYWHSNNSLNPHAIALSTGNTISEQTQKLGHYIDQFRKEIPSGIDLEKIMDDWNKIPAHYKTSDRKMPVPEWKEQSFSDSGQICWQKLTEIISNHCSKRISVYVHIPFCDRRCNFCDCLSTNVPGNKTEKLVLFNRLLLNEISQWANITDITEKPVTTIHFGGGTPNFLPIQDLRGIVDCLKGGLNVTDATELALESTSTLLTDVHLKELLNMGFTRLHVGVQTLDDPVRKILGRRESAHNVIKKLGSAMKLGFVVSVDIIYGLPSQEVTSLIDTLSQLAGEGIHGFSLYHLNITNKNRKFFERLNGFERDIINDYLLFHIADNYLLQKGYTKNHFVHYARSQDKNLYYNHVCRGEDLLALGPTADGFFGDYFYIHNPIQEYLSEAKKTIHFFWEAVTFLCMT